jgi:hypothetical protein
VRTAARMPIYSDRRAMLHPLRSPPSPSPLPLLPLWCKAKSRVFFFSLDAQACVIRVCGHAYFVDPFANIAAARAITKDTSWHDVLQPARFE